MSIEFLNLEQINKLSRYRGGFMLLGRFVVCLFSVAMMFLGGGVASGQQEYPIKPIRIVTSPAGGAGDFLARLIASGISIPLGEQVIVDNRPSGIIPGQTVSKAPPDGYSLLVTGNSLWIGPLLRDTPYDPVKDFSPITAAVRSPNILVVHPSLPVKSVKQLIAMAKARSGELNYGSSGTGSTNHLAAELFKAMAQINIVRVGYKGAGPALNALLGGEVQLMFSAAGSIAPHVKSGRLRALAVTSAERSLLVPDLPTLAASGLPGYEAVTINGLFAPSKTPAAIIDRVNRETVRFLNQSDVKRNVSKIGVEIVASSPEAFAVMIQSEMTSMGKVIEDAGIRTY